MARWEQDVLIVRLFPFCFCLAIIHIIYSFKQELYLYFLDMSPQKFRINSSEMCFEGCIFPEDVCMPPTSEQGEHVGAAPVDEKLAETLEEILYGHFGPFGA